MLDERLGIPDWRLKELKARCDYSISQNKCSLSACVPDLLDEIERLHKVAAFLKCCIKSGEVPKELQD